jgi:hypothetical protein
LCHAGAVKTVEKPGVEKLWTPRAFPVEQATIEIFFCRPAAAKTAAPLLWTSLRQSLRLIAGSRRVKSVSLLTHLRGGRIVATDLHRFEQSIGGRPYLIEVLPVGQNRWRACIVRMPGVPTALMPFYGQTPDEAARHLSEWLTRAYQRTGSPGAPV